MPGKHKGEVDLSFDQRAELDGDIDIEELNVDEDADDDLADLLDL